MIGTVPWFLWTCEFIIRYLVYWLGPWMNLESSFDLRNWFETFNWLGPLMNLESSFDLRYWFGIFWLAWSMIHKPGGVYLIYWLWWYLKFITLLVWTWRVHITRLFIWLYTLVLEFWYLILVPITKYYLELDCCSCHWLHIVYLELNAFLDYHLYWYSTHE